MLPVHKNLTRIVVYKKEGLEAIKNKNAFKEFGVFTLFIFYTTLVRFKNFLILHMVALRLNLYFFILTMLPFPLFSLANKGLTN